MTGNSNPWYNLHMEKLSNETNSILELFKTYKNLRPSHILKMKKLSKKNLHKHLNTLQNRGYIKKSGVAPVVYYTCVDKKVIVSEIDNIPFEDFSIIESNYLYLSASGERLSGVLGFKEWCTLSKGDFNKNIKDYLLVLKACNKIKEKGLINGSSKILSGGGSIDIDSLYFSDFYTLDRFGKSKLGQLIFLAKTSGNLDIAREIIKIIKPSVLNLIKAKKINYVGYIPPTVKRKTQFMKQLEDLLDLNIPKISLHKAANSIPQKSLRKLEDRIKNARETIYIDPTSNINGNVLLIDDATGSGATLSQTAKKLKKLNKNIKSIIGYTVVGSNKGFDVISEV